MGLLKRWENKEVTIRLLLDRGDKKNRKPGCYSLVLTIINMLIIQASHLHDFPNRLS